MEDDEELASSFKWSSSRHAAQQQSGSKQRFELITTIV